MAAGGCGDSAHHRVAKRPCLRPGHRLRPLPATSQLPQRTLLPTPSRACSLGKRVISVGGAMVLVALIGFSRAYLSAHFVSDVVGGFAAGGAWLSAVITAREAMRRRDVANRRVQKSSPRNKRSFRDPIAGTTGSPCARSLRLVLERHLYSSTINPLRCHRARNKEGRRT